MESFAGAGETKTCKELLDGMTNVAVEGGSYLCESMHDIEAFCCCDVDSALSPVKPLTAFLPGTMIKSLADLAWEVLACLNMLVAFISVISTLCVIACM